MSLVSQAGTVVVAVGNTFCGDDGAGSAVLASLAQSPLPGDVTLVDAGADPLSVVETLAGADRAILVDAVRSGATPGTIRLLAGLEEVRRDRGASSHGFGLADAVGMAQALGRPPGRLEIYGIEGATWDPGAGISPAVASAVAVVAAEIHKSLTTPVRPRVSAAPRCRRC